MQRCGPTPAAGERRDERQGCLCVSPLSTVVGWEQGAAPHCVLCRASVLRGACLIGSEGQVPSSNSKVLQFQVLLHCRGLGTLLAVGCMDGSVCLVDAAHPAAPRLVCSAQPHRKYVVAAKWAPSGRHLVCASWDETFSVLRAEQPPSGGSGACSSSGSGELELTLLHQEQSGGQVLDVEFLPSTSGRDSEGVGANGEATFLVAIRGTNYLRQYVVREGRDPGAPGEPAVQLARSINLNAVGDDYVSFSAAHLALAPGGEMVLVSADNGRLIVLELEGVERAGGCLGNIRT